MKRKFLKTALLLLTLCGLISLEAASQCCVAPTNKTVTGIRRREAEVRWSRVIQAGCTTPVKYRVQYRAQGTTTWTNIIVITKKDDQFGDTTLLGLKPGTTYQWRVQGICSPTNKTPIGWGPSFTTLALLTGSGSLQASAFPNPVLNQLTVSGHLDISGKVDISIVSSMGAVVFHQIYNFNAGDFKANIDASRFPKGTYSVTLKSKTQSETVTVLKEE